MELSGVGMEDNMCKNETDLARICGKNMGKMLGMGNGASCVKREDMRTWYITGENGP